MANENNTTKPYIVKNADGVEYLALQVPNLGAEGDL